MSVDGELGGVGGGYCGFFGVCLGVKGQGRRNVGSAGWDSKKADFSIRFFLRRLSVLFLGVAFWSIFRVQILGLGTTGLGSWEVKCRHRFVSFHLGSLISSAACHSLFSFHVISFLHFLSLLSFTSRGYFSSLSVWILRVHRVPEFHQLDASSMLSV